MIKDPSPLSSPGFGVPQGRYDKDQEGLSPNAGFIARSLHGHPFMRFVAEGAATLVAVEVAGALVKKGGVKLGERVIKGAQEGKQWHTEMLQDFRKIQGTLDRLQGVQRAEGIFTSDELSAMAPSAQQAMGAIGNPLRDQTMDASGFWFTRAEQESARQGLGGDPGAVWTMRDELQKRLVSQARALPYALPAAYVTPRAINDRIFEGKSNGPNWHNPVDVIGDFAQQSLKNTFGLLLPWEAAQGAASQGINRFMSLAQNPTAQGTIRQGMQDLSVGVQRSLALVGHDVSNVLLRTTMRTEQFTGAFKQALDDTVSHTKSTPEKIASAARKGVRGFDPRDLPAGFGDIPKFIRTLKSSWGDFGKLLGDRKVPLAQGDTPFEELASIMQDLNAGRAGGGSAVHHSQLLAEYKQVVSTRLVRTGVLSREQANRLTQMMQINSLPGRGVIEAPRKVTSFFEFGEGPMIMGDSGLSRDEYSRKFAGYMRKRLGGVKGIGDVEALTRVPAHGEVVSPLETALLGADRQFAGTLGSTRAKVDAHLQQTRAQVVRYGPDQFKSLRPAYSHFEGPLRPEAQHYLVQQTARAAGLPLQDQYGKSVPLDVLKRRLAERGIDADNTLRMRALLVQNRKIAKPWNLGGFNAFGLRKLSVEDALSRGYFGDKTEFYQKTMRDLEEVHAFQKNMRAPTVNGVYETAGGHVLDLNVYKRKFWRTADMVANEFQIPFLHFRPFQAMGWKTFQAMRQAPGVQIKSGAEFAPYLGAGGEPGRMTDSYLWFKKKGFSGQVTRMTGAGQTQDLPGLFKLHPTDDSSFVGRAMRQSIGDTGRGGTSANNQTWWKRAFAVDEDQPDSFYRLYKRFRGNSTDPRNIVAFARQATTDAPFGDIPEVGRLKGLHNFLGWLRQSGFSPRAVEEVSKLGPEYEKMMKYVVPEDATTGQGRKVIDILSAPDSVATREKMAEIKKAEDVVLSSPNIAADDRRTLQKAFGRITGPGAVPEEASVASAVRSPTIHTRLDQYKQEVMQYFQLRHAILNKGDLDQQFTDLLGHINGLRHAGRITAAEATEFRAALLSTQLDIEGAMVRAQGVSREDILRHQLGRLVGVPGRSRVATAGVMEDIARGHGPGGHPRSIIRNLTGGISAYESPRTRYNPFGGRNTFVPTLRTAMQRDRLGAISSVFGIGTWNKPEVFSGAAVPISHGITRLNRYFSASGLGLDVTRFGGPLDLYARGIIGRRVLPIVAGGTAALAVDRQIGGMVNRRDAGGHKVYSPFFFGKAADLVAGGQVAMAGVLPGGETAGEKEYELKYGNVPIRRGRWWPLGNTPWKGGNEAYFRPSWYRRFQSGYQYTPQTYGSPLERLAYGYDFSPLRPLDPYRFERKHYRDRPYPITGDYFTGPWGPLTSALNLTAGKLLKPHRAMHKEEVAANLANYRVVGEYGMSPPAVGAVDLGGPSSPLSSIPIIGQPLNTVQGLLRSRMGGGSDLSSVPLTGGGAWGGKSSGFSPSGGDARTMLAAVNQRFAQSAGATQSASRGAQQQLAATNASYLAMAGGTGPAAASPYNSRIPFGTVPAGTPISQSKTTRSQFGYESQELLGIYGFSFATAREGLGLGEKDFIPTKPVLASAGTAYGSSRTFWDFNIGGLGDAPTPLEGEYSNLEFGEIARRFIPKPRRLNVVNPIVNQLGMQYPWLPANLKMGDPYSQLPEGEMRLPGAGYERLHPEVATHGYDIATQFSILGDTAWFSDEYRQMEKTINQQPLDWYQWQKVSQTRTQVNAMRDREDFSPYKYKYSSAEDLGMNRTRFRLDKIGEWVSHSDNYFTRKFGGKRTATEDWERNDVYGATFPQWQHPVQDFIRPLIYKASNRNAIAAAAGLGVVSGMFWRTPKAKKVAGFLGGIAGIGLGSMFSTEDFFGKRMLPRRRKQELAVEEYGDILSYTKNRRLYDQAEAAGDDAQAQQFKQQMKQTEYGADLYGADARQLAMAIPKRKREHFMTMLKAPPQERARILSTAPRLERRIYEAAWGMPVEKRPDLTNYFQGHELPGADWEGWSPNVDMEMIKLKMIQSQGLDAAQMGYYPQQVQQANLLNVSYPDYGRSSGSHAGTAAQLKTLMSNQGMYGQVLTRYTPFPGIHLNLHLGAG